MNPVVTARVPEGVRVRGLEVLKEIGATTSDLVNAAFDYVIKEKKLPCGQQATANAAGPDTRELDPQLEAELREFLGDVRVDVPAAWNDLPFEELLDEAMEDRHEGLS